VVIRKGEAWERPAAGPPALTVRGGDADLADAVTGHDGIRVALEPTPDADLARTLGVAAGGAADAPVHDLLVDALRVQCDDMSEHFGVNLLTVGTAPDRLSWRAPRRAVTVMVDGRVVHDGPAAGVVVANGQYLRGADVVPRGHPGDGRIEVQVYAPARRESDAVRRRVRVGDHLPHPGIRQAGGTAVEIHAPSGLPWELDGRAHTAARRFVVAVAPAQFVVVV
jgi:hypothetical protein